MAGPDLSSSAPADGVVLVGVHGEHDIASAPGLRTAIEEAFARSQHVVVDLTPSTFVDSTVLGVLLGARKRAQEEEVGYAVVLEPTSGDPAVRRILEVTGLDELLLVPRGNDTLVEMREEPASPLGRIGHNPVADLLLHGRNVESLRRLAELAETGKPSPPTTRDRTGRAEAG